MKIRSLRKAGRKILWFVKYIWAVVFSRQLMAKCGHRTRLKDKVSAFGEYALSTLSINKDGSMDYCHKCIEKMAIQCAWCGKSIFIGDAVTLYSPNKKYEVPEHTIVYSQDPLRLVGCMRGNCADTGADQSGFWIPPGEVKKVPTVIEMLISTGASCAIVSGDTATFVK